MKLWYFGQVIKFGRGWTDLLINRISWTISRIIKQLWD